MSVEVMALMVVLLVLTARATRLEDEAERAVSELDDADRLRELIEEEYLLAYPADYRVEGTPAARLIAPVDEEDGGCPPFLLITSEPARNRTLDRIADELAGPLERDGMPVRRVPLELDEAPALLLDGLPGETIGRRLLVDREDRIVALNFAPGLACGGDPARLDRLYETVVDSFRFVR